jgi:hypothetical protein
MTILEVQPLVLKDVELLIGTGTPDDFRKHVSGVTYTPTAPSNSWTGLGLNTHTDVGTPTWTLDLDYVQDWTSTNSLSLWLFEHKGESHPVVFTPIDGNGPSFSSTVTIVPGAIGGQVNSFATTTVQLGTDEPILVPPVVEDATTGVDDVATPTTETTTPDARRAQKVAA